MILEGHGPYNCFFMGSHHDKSCFGSINLYITVEDLIKSPLDLHPITTSAEFHCTCAPYIKFKDKRSYIYDDHTKGSTYAQH